jgi:hypothetical protein
MSEISPLQASTSVMELVTTPAAQEAFNKHEDGQ